MFEFTPEQQKWRDVGKQVAKKVLPIANQVDKTGVFSWELMNIMRDAKLFDLLIPKKYGGVGADIVSYCLASEEVAKGDLGMSNMIMDQGGTVLPLIDMGTEAQKVKYINRFLKEKKWWAGANTEPQGGSDLGSIQTTAVRKGDYYIINGRKSWCTMGSYADQFLVMTTTDPSKKIAGLTGFWVDKEYGGISVIREHNKMGWRTHNTAELSFKDVKVPASNIIGKEGDGYEVFFCGLNLGRLSVAAQGLGVAEAAFEYATNYAQNRIAFGKPIAEFQAIRFMLADMAIGIETARAITLNTAFLMDKKGSRDSEVMKLAAIAKTYVSDFVVKCTTDAVQILGGTGYTDDHPVEKWMRDAKGLQIADGTNQIMRVLIASYVAPKKKK